jgi:hypothetical protein
LWAGINTWLNKPAPGKRLDFVVGPGQKFASDDNICQREGICIHVRPD